MKDIARSMSLAVTIICCVGFGWALGYFLDDLFQVSPVFMVIGLLGGTVLSFMALYSWAKKK